MKRNVWRGLLLLIVLTICAMPAGAVQKPSKTRSKRPGSHVAAVPAAIGPECPAEESVGQAGFRAFIDPETGQLREGTPEEHRALSKGAKADASNATESPEVVVYPDGVVVVDLKGHFMQSIVVVRNPDGSLSASCGPDSLKHAAAPKPAHAPILEER